MCLDVGSWAAAITTSCISLEHHALSDDRVAPFVEDGEGSFAQGHERDEVHVNHMLVPGVLPRAHEGEGKPEQLLQPSLGARLTS